MDGIRVEPALQRVRLRGRAGVLPDEQRRQRAARRVDGEQAVPEAADRDGVDPLSRTRPLEGRLRHVDEVIRVELRAPTAAVRDLVAGLGLVAAFVPAPLVVDPRADG